MVYLGLEDKKEAYEWLEKGFKERSAWMPYLNMDPRLDELRSDPDSFNWCIGSIYLNQIEEPPGSRH